MDEEELSIHAKLKAKKLFLRKKEGPRVKSRGWDIFGEVYDKQLKLNFIACMNLDCLFVKRYTSSKIGK